MKEKLKELISEGQGYNFNNNSYNTSYGVYSKASDSLLAWISSVEDFILTYYGEDSSPYKLFQSIDRSKLSGNYQSSFEKQLTKIMGALKACEKIEPKPPKRRVEDNQILNLIKNPYFYMTIVVLVGAAFSVGLKLGSSKFDKEKIDLYNNNKELIIELNRSKQLISQKDSTVELLQKSVYSLSEKISKTK